MPQLDPIAENLSLLIAEMDGQLQKLVTYFKDPQSELAAQLMQRAGYSGNLSSRVSKACLAAMIREKQNNRTDLHLQGIDTIARNLDLIARLGRRAVDQAEKVERKRVLRAMEYVAPLGRVRKTLGRIQSALADRDSKLAVTIGKERQSIETFHSSLFETYTREMEGSKHTQDLAFALLTLNEITRIGEALQAISEAILSINIGQSVRFEKYFTLRSILSSVSDGKEVALTPLAETRSGSAISSVRMRGPSGDTISAVFKDGDKRKVKEERVGVKSWNSVYPGLAPEILSYEKSGKSAALLIEHLDGETFEDIVLGGSDAALAEAQTALHRTVRDIWRQTASPEPAAMQAMDQLSKRMKDVYRLHPWFARAAQNVNGCVVHCFDELIVQAASREERLSAPFSVYIHGDFNLDNVIYDPVSAKIRFIDLHRSRYMDYVQDVSVFMVSNYRLQVQDGPVRARIGDTALGLHRMAARFARARKDTTFEYRLALGLARSFASSTRFVFDKEHARRMFLRARYLLDLALAVPEGREARLKLPIKELFGD